MLNVEADGKTILVSRAWDRGIQLSCEMRRLRLLARTYPLEGMTISWPKSVPRKGRIEGTFVFVMTSEEIDLRFLEDVAQQSRAFPGVSRRSTPYDVTHIRYFLHPSNASDGAR